LLEERKCNCPSQEDHKKVTPYYQGMPLATGAVSPSRGEFYRLEIRSAGGLGVV